jgi:Family of unknown function (DUF5677)
MQDDDTMFGSPDAEDDPFMAELMSGLLAEGVQEDDLEERINAALPQATAAGASHLLAELKARSGDMFADRHQIRSGFLARQREKWGKPLDLLFMLLEAARESGEEYAATFQKVAEAEQDFVFLALCKLHARACLVASEVHWLLEGGYASGAMARWRTLHEIAVVGCFLRENCQAVAERYLLHHEAEAFKSATDFQKHHQTLDYEPFTPDELQGMEARCNQLCERFGTAYKQQWGWAAEALKSKKPTFTDVENAVSLDHYRPYFKLASHANHAGSKGLHYDLGNDLNPPGTSYMLAGPSDAGLCDPGACTANSVLQATTNLILYRNAKLSALIVVESVALLTDEILESFATADDELRTKAEAFQKGR